ncbi:MAG TPA: NAD(P)/FAD-dependent oxidoreductase [Solirubrobacteraceae bacterium]|nr:NAD(P)/FAD-dependent oxidoreductase [Solirubrobacteraceae bacterium]
MSPGPAEAGERYDVAIVGASTAGCTAARFYAQRGARVALIERRPALDAYKTVCTHFIQSSATPTIERLGLAPLLERAGAVHNGVDVWTGTSGWINTARDAPYGFNITRRALDPMLRELAAQTPGVELLSGWTATGLLGNGRPEGVLIEDRNRTPREVRAKLVVAADGRESKVARWARVPGRVKPHGRFFYWGYWRGVRPAGERSRMWLTDPDAAYTFPNEDGLTVVLVAPHRDRLPEFHADLHGAYRRMLNALPDGPDMREATLEGKLLGKLELPNVFRPAARPGVAFVGDAALAGDPLWGIGCGWAFQSAEWLVEQTADALDRGEQALDAALDRYRKLHRKRLLPHYMMISDLASGRPINALERRLYRAAARDEDVVRAFERIGSRNLPPSSILAPRLLARITRFGSAAQPAA